MEFNEFIENNEIIDETFVSMIQEENLVENDVVESMLQEEETVSDNDIDYTEYLETIIERLEGIEENVESISNNIISAGNGSDNGNNNQIGTVSQNILTTPINEYSLTDGLLVVGLTMGLIVGVILIIRRCIYKWS